MLKLGKKLSGGVHRFKPNKERISFHKFLHSESSDSHEAHNVFIEDYQRNHIPLNTLQRGVLSIGSAAMSILDPRRGDMIACLGEATGETALKHILRNMVNSEEGRDILRLQPRINTRTVDIDKLKKYPDGTLGKTYSNFLIHNDVTPDSRTPVQFVDDVDLAYVMQRYREVHDLFHTVLLMPTNMLGEVTVKWVEAIQTKLPMCIGGAIFGPVRLKPKHRQLYLKYYLPWALETGKNSSFLMNVFFERRWEQTLEEFHKEFNIKPLVLDNIDIKVKAQ